MNGQIFRFSFALLMIAVLAGCTTLQGGAPGVVSDEDIAQDVRSRLGEDSVTKNQPFGVEVMNGVVYLRGSATVNESVKARAANIAAGAEGARDVVFGDAGYSAPASRPAAAPARYQPAQKVQPKAAPPAVSKKATTTAPVARPSAVGAHDDLFAPVPMQ